MEKRGSRTSTRQKNKLTKMRTVSAIDFEGAASASVSEGSTVSATGSAEITGGAGLEVPEAMDAGGKVGTELEVPRLAWFLANEIEIASVCALNFSRYSESTFRRFLFF